MFLNAIKILVGKAVLELLIKHYFACFGHYSRTVGHTKILMPVLSFSDNLLQGSGMDSPLCQGGSERPLPFLPRFSFFLICHCFKVRYRIRSNNRPGRYIFSVVNICIELSLYAVAVRFLDYRFFLL